MMSPLAVSFFHASPETHVQIIFCTATLNFVVKVTYAQSMNKSQ